MKELLKNRQIGLGTIAWLIFLSVVAGLVGFGFVNLVNRVFAVLVNDPNELDQSYYIVAFSVLVVTFFVSRRLLSGGVIKLSQSIYWNTRMDIVRLVIRAPYRKVRDHRDQIYATLTHDVGNITQASLLIIEFVTSVVLIVACLAYMAFLSLVLFGITMGIIVLGIGAYELLSRKSNRRFRRTRDLEDRFMASFNAILNGAKEINMDRRKGMDIFSKKTGPISYEAMDNNRRAYVGYLNSQLIGQGLFYGLIAFLILFAGNLMGVTVTITISFAFVLLYILGPIGNVMTILPFMSRASISLGRLRRLEDKMSRLTLEEVGGEAADISKFESLIYKGCLFSYGEGQFGVGPVDFSLQRGEINFIYGGNGSGKTTFMNTLLGLFAPTGGTIELNGVQVDPNDLTEFKSMFAVVFSDFFLFDEFYGMKDVDTEQVQEYLQLFEIEDKVVPTDRGFSTIDLSTGQKKRLALIAAMLENKPILVMDEWAADQDPHFREKFYNEIIPIFREKGLAVIAITHDDRFYGCADRLFRMDYGQLREVDARAAFSDLGNGLE